MTDTMTNDHRAAILVTELQKALKLPPFSISMQKNLRRVFRRALDAAESRGMQKAGELLEVSP